MIFQIWFAWKYLCIALILEKKKILNVEDRLVVIFFFSSFLPIYLVIHLFILVLVGGSGSWCLGPLMGSKGDQIVGWGPNTTRSREGRQGALQQGVSG